MRRGFVLLRWQYGPEGKMATKCWVRRGFRLEWRLPDLLGGSDARLRRMHAPPSAFCYSQSLTNCGTRSRRRWPC
jgi:hypothetical protein